MGLFNKQEPTPVVDETGLLGAIATELEADAKERLRMIQARFESIFGVHMDKLVEAKYDEGVFSSGNVYWRVDTEHYSYELQWSRSGLNAWKDVETSLQSLHDHLTRQMDG